MKNVGAALIIAGILLIVFKLAGCENEKPSTLTDWMTNWGEKVEWAIKAGFIVLGIIILSTSGRRSK
ncbi:MAG: hypothetical protein WDN26_12840 [Chitinophagaceae bacterium]